ncbi:MAG: LysM peptidoglycan-binding domain-containing protein [Bdellovibrionales bacterium]
MECSKNVIYLACAFAVVLTGCASGSGFRGRAVRSTAEMPLPVEIADEIAIITNNGIAQIGRKTESTINQVGSSLVIEGGPQVMGAAGQNIPTPSLTETRIENVENLPEKPKEQQKKQSEERNVKLNYKKRDFKLGHKGPLAKKINGKNVGPLKENLKAAQGTGQTVYYTVRLGDTLMKIAFDKYGNYLRWKEIYQLNKDKMAHYTKMPVGTVLTIENVQYVFIKKEGTPYLIRKNDTLKSIAKKVYGDESRWRDIWKNNPQLILNPKKIYAGFTLYYKPDGKVQLRTPSSSTQ